MTVHVVAAGKSGLVAALRRGCERHSEVVLWEVPPPPSRVVAGDAVVVDLVDLTVGVHCEEFHRLLPRAELFVVAGPCSMDAAWVTLFAHRAVRVVYCDEAARRDGYGPAVGALAGHLGGPTAHELATCVLEQEPRFRGLSELVTAVCQSPGEIRRPADLARAAGVSPRVVAGHCGAVGYKRVEHFLCAVRLGLRQCLVTRHGARSGDAWCRAGVADRSNFRRQVARAQRASPTAIDWSRIGGRTFDCAP